MNDLMKHYPSDGSRELIEIVNGAVELAKNDLSDYDNISSLGSGSTGEEALAIALYANLKYENDFDKVIVCAVNHNGDTDSTGAVAGNIIGAIIGYDSISEKWKQDLELKDIILDVADDLYLGGTDLDNVIHMDVWMKKYI